MFARIVFIVIVFSILMIPLVGLFCNFAVGKSVAAGTKNFPEFSLEINKEESRLNYLIDFESPQGVFLNCVQGRTWYCDTVPAGFSPVLKFH